MYKQEHKETCNKNVFKCVLNKQTSLNLKKLRKAS